jgi:putative nucleotidyltransferase with HDIG domain
VASGNTLADSKWFDITMWGGTLIVIAYTMGSLYDRKEAHVRELRETYNGVLIILRQFISKDKYTQNHSYRVALYAAKIAFAMKLDTDRIEDVRAAALLHDIGKLDISRELLYKAASLTKEERGAVEEHVPMGTEMLRPVGGSLRRVIPIVLAHHDKFDGSGYHPTRGEEIPIEARIISVADVYDALTSDRPYRKAMPPFEAKEVICKGSGTQFDPRVVEAFVAIFDYGQMEVPEFVV